jgi:hypothetical protein
MSTASIEYSIDYFAEPQPTESVHPPNLSERKKLARLESGLVRQSLGKRALSERLMVPGNAVD